jgi:predicted ATP-dependent endonuclease of OLD family
MMKLIAFRIRNFRSIIDSGWQNLSPDNITCLIGQNESGKTSILEGLNVFYSGLITEDVLRSDLSFPEVSCRFSVPVGWLIKNTENPGTEFKELLSGITQIELTRSWISDFSSVINVSGEIGKYLNSKEDTWKLHLQDVLVRLEMEINTVSDLESKLNIYTEEETEIRLKLNESSPKSLGFRLFGRSQPESTQSDIVDVPALKNQLNDLKRLKEDISKQLQKRQLIKRVADQWKSLRERHAGLENHLNQLSVKLEERHQKMTLLMQPIEDDPNPEWKGILQDYRKTKNELDLCNSDVDRHLSLSDCIMDGSTIEDAEKKVDNIMKTYKLQYNSEVLGNKYFEHCPVFALFEDFGGLLPNRIDLEDIITRNEQVEGYKAAHNFLTIAQLDYSFFQQQSSRILKQKIENLNQTLTNNFQDFWQQSIGRNNKIQIQFELDHYNSTYSDKAGKPYLEFWIKDEGERLYPKQRSRGVRWFLSFYMELKASANMKDKELVLLVDEPGVSLHARAQEDVLKVFEDIKEKIQVIYTTHSPHLVEINKLHRVLAVQRDDHDSQRSSTQIFDPLRLSAATPDTLTPLQSILGNPMSGEGFSPNRINLIVNDSGSFYVLSAIIHLMGIKVKISVVPSTQVSSIHYCATF